MNKTLVVFCVVVILASLATAGTPAIEKGSAAMWFNFNGLTTMSYQNSAIGLNYLFKDKTGAGIALNFSHDSEDDGIEEKEKTTALGMDLYLIHYPFQKGPVALYLAPGVGFNFTTYKDKDISEFHVNSTDIWLGGSVGVEWWIFDQVSLSASNWVGLEIDLFNNKINDDKGTDVHLGILGSSTASIVLAFYFK
ncbi:MAG TPA: outer membrane beta-barrel protein [Candidatus Marinimicrobia bacterium]|jgi:hypothetical protein|nr:outer membrane beta-barrel protein [Candidatus Neomarinimicrobiota bacterium]HQC62865.1 outer membrane beta-barrel protein [Candidatus Neomarinimicrobiota bacterium]